MRFLGVPLAQALAEAIEDAVALADFGRPNAARRGRDPRWPYVPIITDTRRGHTNQVLGRAFATRGEALACAEAHIAALRASLRRRLAEPRQRALRAQHGLPRELSEG